MTATFLPPSLDSILKGESVTGGARIEDVYTDRKTQLIEEGLTIEALDRALQEEALPADIDVVRKLVDADGRKRFDEYVIRFVTRRLHWIRRQFDVGLERDVALMVAILSQIPVFAWSSVGPESPFAVGSFFGGVAVAVELAASPGAYISYIVDDDAIFSLVGVHYFLLKNQAILASAAVGGARSAGGKTARFLQEAIVDIFQNANHLRFNLVQMVALWSQCQTKLHTLTFPLVKCLLSTDYADTRPTVAMYDLLLQDALLPTVLLVEPRAGPPK